MRLLGLTGNIASGKSTVASWLAERGATVLDADRLVHELYADASWSRHIAQLFGDGVLDSEGVVNRSALAEMVFRDADAMRRLEAVVHPAVARLRDKKLQALQAWSETPQVVVIEAVKLIEAGQSNDCETVWCVVSTPAVQMKRLHEVRGLTLQQSELRLHDQPELETKRRLLKSSGRDRTLVVLENNGTLQELQATVEREWQAFLAGRHTA